MNRISRARPFIVSIIIALLLISAFLLWSSETSAKPLLFQQTWPSRTPTPSTNIPTNTPSGGQPTSEPPGGDPGQGTEQPPGGETTETPTDIPRVAAAYVTFASPTGER